MISDIIKAVFVFFIDFIETAVVALSIFVVIYVFLFQPHQVRGNSMYPNHYDAEYLLTNKVTYRLDEPQRGDVIVFKAPQNTDYDYIKRIIGMPDETIMVKDGGIYINDARLDESDYLDSEVTTSPGMFLSEGKKFEIPENEYFVMGDNRNQSSDSRDWGTVPNKNIVGKAWFRYWPVSKLELLPDPNYF